MQDKPLQIFQVLQSTAQINIQKSPLSQKCYIFFLNVTCLAHSIVLNAVQALVYVNRSNPSAHDHTYTHTPRILGKPLRGTVKEGQLGISSFYGV